MYDFTFGCMCVWLYCVCTYGCTYVCIYRCMPSEMVWLHEYINVLSSCIPYDKSLLSSVTGCVCVCVCATAVFKPTTTDALKSAVNTYCKSSNGLCNPHQPQGHAPINEWDVSEVTSMEKMFYKATYFKDDISKWDVAKVTTMFSMFEFAKSFNGGYLQVESGECYQHAPDVCVRRIL